MPEIITRKPFPFKIGSDPEFSVLFREKKMHARETFQALLGAYDKRYAEGHIGVDGCAATGELRPNASNTADEHANNIEGIFKKSYKNLKGFNFTTISLYAPIGGHIHLDLTPKHKELPVENFILPFLLPIWLSEDTISREIRKKTGYGKLWNFKRGEASTEVATLEVRGPSAEWMTTKQSTIAVLGYLGTIWAEIAKRPELFQQELREICGTTSTDGAQIASMLTSDNNLYIGTVMRKLRSILPTFEFYQEYKKEIDLILNPKKFKRLKTFYEFSVFQGWDIEKKEKNINQKKFIQTESDDAVNLDAIQEILDNDDENSEKINSFFSHQSIAHNTDRNVKLLDEELSKRIFANGMKPEQELFLFGLRKGIDSPLVFNSKQELFEGAELIKTEQDLETFKKTADKMIDKAKKAWKSSIYTIKPLEGIVLRKADPIFIGIPFEWRRLPIQIDRFLKLAWKYLQPKIENPVKVNKETLKKDQGGAFTKALEKQQSPLNSSAIDSSSQGLIYARRGIQEYEEELEARQRRDLEIQLAKEFPNLSPLDSWFEHIKKTCEPIKILIPSPGINEERLHFLNGYKLEEPYQNDTAVIIINHDDQLARIQILKEKFKERWPSLDLTTRELAYLPRKTIEVRTVGDDEFNEYFKKFITPSALFQGSALHQRNNKNPYQIFFTQKHSQIMREIDKEELEEINKEITIGKKLLGTIETPTTPTESEPESDDMIIPILNHVHEDQVFF